MRPTRHTRTTALAIGAALVLAATPASATKNFAPAEGPGGGGAGDGSSRLTCSSVPGGRQRCTADTSTGIAILRSTGSTDCVPGKTWGYDATGVWVADGCGAEFVLGPPARSEAQAPVVPPAGAAGDPPDELRERVRTAAAEKGFVRVSCSSRAGEREHCPADTTRGVTIARSSGHAPCLLGKTWGYDDDGIWVAEGCGGEFIAGAAAGARGPSEGEAEAAPPDEAKRTKSPDYIPNRGFRLYEGEHGQIYMRLFTYVRYLNQKSLDDTYTDYLGNVKSIQIRQDVQLNKFFLPFSGWFLTPDFRYYLYVWSSNPSQGDPAQVVGAGNISYTFNRWLTLSGGIGCLPTTRSTEGNFPYWLGVDARLTSDEFFRGSYTTGFWARGQLAAGVNYMAMLANNLSTLGVSAAQLDNGLNTTSLMINWLPTTKEFGFMGEFGDYEAHEQAATRLGLHYTHSREDKQSQPGANSIENSQVRLTDGSPIFTPDILGEGITVEQLDYDMVAFDGGVKYRGFSLDGEFFHRWLGDYAGPGTGGLDEIGDHGFQLQASAMALAKILQPYLGVAAIRGDYGDGSELRAGVNWYPFKKREIKLNAEWLHLDDCPVGYTAVPYPVGGNGNVIHTNIVMSF